MYKYNDMKLSQFHFRLPEEQIAQFPTLYRDDARLLVLHRKTGEIEHRHVSDTVRYFEEQDLFIFNDTKVYPARLFSHKENQCTDRGILTSRAEPRKQVLGCVG